MQGRHNGLQIEKGKTMEKMIAYCGLICHTCAIFLATREKDDEKRAQMRAEIALKIKELYGKEYKPEDINDCDGCRTKSGRIFCKDCQIRNCAKAKSIENCAYCTEYACEKLQEFFSTDTDAKKRLDQIRSGR